MQGTTVDDLPEVFAASAAPRQTLSDAVRRGTLRRLARGLYTKDLETPTAELVKRRLYDLVAALYPGAVIADRSARLGARPAADGSLFLVHDRGGPIELDGIVLRPRKGPGPLTGDLALPAGLHMSSTPRALLENARLTRGREGRLPRTLTRPELEEWLEALLAQRGEAGLRALREDVRKLAEQLDMERELGVLDPLIGAVLGTRQVRAASRGLRARQRGRPYDARRVELFEALFAELDRSAPVSRPVLDPDSPRYAFLPFFEAYFSNFIEGTEFAVEEAAEIVFEGVIPAARPADAHDVIGTYRLAADLAEMARVPADERELLELLRRRHHAMLEARPEASPGAFKAVANRVAGVEFVAPELVEGTLAEGFALYRRLAYPFARAVFQMFLVTEVHPFVDGNGRIARVMMNAELVAAREHRIVVPQVSRNNYVVSLRALSVNGRTDALVRTLDFAQRYTAAIDFSTFDGALAQLERTNAFRDPAEADASGLRLVLPDPAAPL